MVDGEVIRSSYIELDKLARIDSEVMGVRRSRTPKVGQFVEKVDESIDYYDTYNIQVSFMKRKN